MKIKVVSRGLGADDEYFKCVCRQVLYDLDQNGMKMPIAGVDLSFECRSQNLPAFPKNLVTVSFGTTEDNEEKIILAKVLKAIKASLEGPILQRNVCFTDL